MNLARSRALTVLGVLGLVATASVVGVTFTSDGVAPGHRLALTCAPTVTGPVVHVTLNDRGTAILGTSSLMVLSLHVSPTTIASGPVTIVATNVGALRHALYVWPVRRDVDATGLVQLASDSPSLGEASRSCGRGRGGGIAPGSSSWITLSLARGTYMLACDERGYYTSDMVRALRVT